MSLTTTELFYLMILQKVPNLGDASAKKLISKAGSAEAIFKEKKHNLLKIDGIGDYKLKELFSKDNFSSAEEEIKYINDNNILAVSFKDENYPEKLKHCLDGPILFFQRGNINLKNKRIISIVGTRKVTTYGTAFCEKFIEELAPLKPVIISGFAYGVDIVAHRTAIKNNLQTVACLAHGLDQIYPAVHKKYVPEVEHNGGFITEFWRQDPFDRNNFLKRNRIIAGLSEATIVVESGEKGGSLVTADIANSYDRDVFAVPGRAFDSQSQGCNNLIKTQQAHLLSSAADLIYILNWKLDNEKPKAIQQQLFVDLTNEEKIVYKFLNENSREILDTIAINCTMPTYKIVGILLSLEIKGLVRPLPGKLFEKI